MPTREKESVGTVAGLSARDATSVLRAASRPDVVFHLTRKEIKKYSPSEWDIIGLLAEGYDEEEARVMLSMTEYGIKRHLYNIRQKTGADSNPGVIDKLRNSGCVA